MSYDEDFYKSYDRYLAESRVRKKHDMLLSMWAARTDSPRLLSVIDLGCGRSQEFRWFMITLEKYRKYRGYDVHAPEDGESEVADYRSLDFIETVNQLDWKPNAFVSLFSTECTAPAQENTELYERLFREIPTLQYGLVAGFYYAERTTENPIEEAGGIVSWQTVESLEDMGSSVYDEIRVVTRVPSKMFGENVVEVWRMLTRQD